MIIYNASGHKLEIADILVNGYSLVLGTAASATIFDEDGEKSTALATLIAAGTVTVTGTTEPTTIEDSIITTAKGLKTTWTMTAAATGTLRGIWGIMTTFTSMTSGTLASVRGEMNVAASCAVSGSSFLYGTQGKLTMAAGSSLDIGSGYACGVIGQIDITNGTMTGGHIAAVIASIQDTNNAHTHAQVNGIYVEMQPSVGGSGYINSVLQAVGNATTMFDLSGAVASTFVTLPVSTCAVVAAGTSMHHDPNAVTCDGHLIIKVGATLYDVPFYDHA